MNVGKYFWRYSFLAHSPPAVRDSANLMQETPFSCKLKFAVVKLNKLS